MEESNHKGHISNGSICVTSPLQTDPDTTLRISVIPGQVSCSGVADQLIMDSTIFVFLLFGYNLVGFLFLFCFILFFCLGVVGFFVVLLLLLFLLFWFGLIFPLGLEEFWCYIGFLFVFLRKNLKLDE